MTADYHPVVGGILNLHGSNLHWFGVATFVGCLMIFRDNMMASWVSGMVGGLADPDYLLFVDFRAT